MALNVVLVTQRQSSKGIYLSWNAMEGVASYLVFVAQRKMTPEELEAAVLLGGTDDCTVLKLGPDATGIVDDVSPEGEARYYGVSMSFADGAPKGARFKATPDTAPAGAVSLSSKGVKKQSPSAKPAAAAAPVPAPAPSIAPAAPKPASVGPAAPKPAAAAPAAASTSAAAMANTGGYRVTAPAAEASAPAARPAAAPAPSFSATAAIPSGYKVPVPPAEAPAPAPRPASIAPAAPAPKPEVKPPAPAPKPAAAAPASSASSGASLDSLSNTAFYRVAIAENPVEVVQKPIEIPLEDNLEYRMKGGTQTWDGLRLYWERDFDAAAYEIVIADHQLYDRELNDALAGRDDFTSCTATGPSTMCVIDNITQRDARGWYLILARDRKGNRKVHPFQVGDAQESGKPVAIFANPNRTGELRGEVEGMLEEAREQVERWKSEGDGGAKREAQRIAADALLIYPNHPGAKALQAELG